MSPEPLMPLAFLRSSTVVPYFLAMVERFSPLFTLWSRGSCAAAFFPFLPFFDLVEVEEALPVLFLLFFREAVVVSEPLEDLERASDQRELPCDCCFVLEDWAVCFECEDEDEEVEVVATVEVDVDVEVEVDVEVLEERARRPRATA